MSAASNKHNAKPAPAAGRAGKTGPKASPAPEAPLQPGGTTGPVSPEQDWFTTEIAEQAEDASEEARFKRVALACVRKDIATVQNELKDWGAWRFAGREIGRPTLLHFAVIGGDKDVLKVLIERGADLQETTRTSLVEDVPEGPKTPLDLARIMGKTNAIAFLEEACDKAGCDGETHTVKMMRYPDGGLFVGVYNTYTGERVHRTMAERHRNGVEGRAGARESDGDLDAIGAIEAAVESNDREQLKRVIDGYPDGQQILVDRGGNTILHMAAIRGNIDIVTILLSKGADPFLRNHQGQRAIDVVSDTGIGPRHTRRLLALAMGDDRPFMTEDGRVNDRIKELFQRKAASAGISMDKLAELKAQHEAARREDLVEQRSTATTSSARGTTVEGDDGGHAP
ncbi:Ankyrin repeat-containing protein [Paraburkholderia phenazinium]|uniref:Ankyrin repeat-containing protein n=1 Tax=Paraburkholderia phenazinium TaxID=60549 RepID=A0A1G7YBB6_9BURK|nr:ankyrin repeat domain-containing protein [Paraburkholderia phenazinium]SDG93788.1 Ankyrin repeat-containing protein [Paraburkholderia phenazinium]